MMATIYINKDKNELPDRIENDVYETEHNLIRASYDMFLSGISHPRKILDVGAGDGRWGTIALEYTTKINPAWENGELVVPSIHGVEIRDLPKPEAFDYWYIGDFLEWIPGTQYDLIVSNPPYFIAEECIRKSWDILKPGGSMIFLLKLAFLASIKRYNGLWNEIYPYNVAVCSRRPSFYGGGTNGDEYAVYFWYKTMFGEPLGAPRTWNMRLLMYERDS